MLIQSSMTAPDLASSSPSSPPPPDRAELIRTAVVFLRSPRVASASDDKKRLFLKSKSLSDAEVDVAMALAADASRGGSDAAPNDAAEAVLSQQQKSVSAGQVLNRNVSVSFVIFIYCAEIVLSVETKIPVNNNA